MKEKKEVLVVGDEQQLWKYMKKGMKEKYNMSEERYDPCCYDREHGGTRRIMSNVDGIRSLSAECKHGHSTDGGCEGLGPRENFAIARVIMKGKSEELEKGSGAREAGRGRRRRSRVRGHAGGDGNEGTEVEGGRC